MRSIYLDNNATTPIDPEVADAIVQCWSRLGGNPASQHQFGRHARRILEEAREQIAHLLGANTDGVRSDRVIFTSGGTESNNLALCGLAGRPPGRIVISAIEHPSVAGTGEHLARSGFDLVRLPVDRTGVVRPAALDQLLNGETRLASVILANNETGVIQPIAEIADGCNSAGVPLHTDAVQAVAKTRVDFQALRVAALSVSAHKFHGPVGIGALLVRHDVSLEPILQGGFQQQGLRPGTQPVALAVGMSKALEIWHGQADRRQQHMTDLRARLESRLTSSFPELEIHGASVSRVPHTLSIAFPGVDRQALVMALDLAGVAASTGSACASGSSEPSPILLAMGIDLRVVECSIRLSLSGHMTTEEVDLAAERIIRVYNDLRQAAGGRKSVGSSRKVPPKTL